MGSASSIHFYLHHPNRYHHLQYLPRQGRHTSAAMHYKSTLIFVGLAALSVVKAQEFDNNDVPMQCRSVCQAMVDAARNCDNTNSGDRQEVDCICNTQGASTQLPECAACVRQYDTDDDDDDNDENDVDEVMRSCGFSSTTFNAAATSGSASSTGSMTITSASSGSMVTSTYVTTSTDMDDDDDDDDDNETRTFTRTTVFAAGSSPTNAAGSVSSAGQGVTSAAVSSGTGVVGAATSSAGNAVESATGDSGAAATALPILGAGAGALLAVVGLL